MSPLDDASGVAAPAVAAMLRDARLLVTAGTGGVGKTTTAAALALQGALSGRRTAVLTIDPARRLANALGLTHFSERAQHVSLDGLAGVPGVAGAHLSAMMLDMRATADDMVRRHAPDAAAAERLMANPYYQAFSTSLAGTQEYMAVEQVAALLSGGQYDLVVLDTPPSNHALDFLDAPERLLNALDHRAINWLYRPAGGAGGTPAAPREQGYGARLLGRGRQMVFKSLNRLTGGPFFEDLAIFLQSFSALFDQFRESSRAVQALLRADSTQFLVVTSPAAATVREAMAFRASLMERGFPFGGFLCNRVHLPVANTPAEELEAALAPDPAAGVIAEALESLVEDHNQMALRDAGALSALEATAPGQVSVVPLLPEDVHDLPGLMRVGEALLGG